MRILTISTCSTPLHTSLIESVKDCVTNGILGQLVLKGNDKEFPQMHELIKLSRNHNFSVNKPPLNRGTVALPLSGLFRAKDATPFTPFKW